MVREEIAEAFSEAMHPTLYMLYRINTLLSLFKTIT